MFVAVEAFLESHSYVCKDKRPYGIFEDAS